MNIVAALITEAIVFMLVAFYFFNKKNTEYCNKMADEILAKAMLHDKISFLEKAGSELIRRYEKQIKEIIENRNDEVLWLEKELADMRDSIVERGYARYVFQHKPIENGRSECGVYRVFEWVQSEKVIKNILESRKKK